jgi:hypothetical protein
VLRDGGAPVSLVALDGLTHGLGPARPAPARRRAPVDLVRRGDERGSTHGRADAAQDGRGDGRR